MLLITPLLLLPCAYAPMVFGFQPSFQGGSQQLKTGAMPLTQDMQRVYTARCEVGRRLPFTSHVVLQSSREGSGNGAVVDASPEPSDDKALQAVFDQYCGSGSKLTFEALASIPMFEEMIKDGDLEQQELKDFWSAAISKPDDDAVDFAAFATIYRNVDELFEDDDDDSETAVTAASSSTAGDTDEKQLNAAFDNLSDDNMLLSKEALQKWDEIKQLIEENLLGRTEFDSLWKKVAGDKSTIESKGFLDFNSALDELFEAEEDEAGTTAGMMVEGDDLDPEEIFNMLADKDMLIGFEDLKRWGELQEILSEGELLPAELQSMFETVSKSSDMSTKLDQNGFVDLYNAIDSLFEEDGDEDQEGTAGVDKSESNVSESSNSDETTSSDTKQKLIDMLDSMAVSDDEDDMPDSDEEEEAELPCGLTCDENTEAAVTELVTALETETSNMVLSSGFSVSETDLTGDWDLMFTNSGMMKFNQGLSGLGGSVPNGKFAGLRQKLTASKYMTDVTYTERIKVNPDVSSFDVTISGDWELKQSVSLLTGKPTVLLNVEPDKVVYGPTSTRADHWKSVRAMNLLDITYLDNDLRIMRGNTSTNTIFVFRRA